MSHHQHRPQNDDDRSLDLHVEELAADDPSAMELADGISMASTWGTAGSASSASCPATSAGTLSTASSAG